MLHVVFNEQERVLKSGKIRGLGKGLNIRWLVVVFIKHYLLLSEPSAVLNIN